MWVAWHILLGYPLEKSCDLRDLLVGATSKLNIDSAFSEKPEQADS